MRRHAQGRVPILARGTGDDDRQGRVSDTRTSQAKPPPSKPAAPSKPHERPRPHRECQRNGRQRRGALRQRARENCRKCQEQRNLRTHLFLQQGAACHPLPATAESDAHQSASRQHEGDLAIRPARTADKDGAHAQTSKGKQACIPQRHDMPLVAFQHRRRGCAATRRPARNSRSECEKRNWSTGTPNPATSPQVAAGSQPGLPAWPRFSHSLLEKLAHRPTHHPRERTATWERPST